MPRRPPPPPEAQAIALARKGLGLSIRAAAKRAGMSESLWRRIEYGRMLETAAGGVPYSGTAAKVAVMAQAVRLTPACLRETGRADAAKELLRLPELGLPEASGLGTDAAAIVRETVEAIEMSPVLTPAQKKAHRDQFYEDLRQYAAGAAQVAKARLRAAQS